MLLIGDKTTKMTNGLLQLKESLIIHSTFQLSLFEIHSDQFALPVRRYTKNVQYHALGHGVGGVGVHYGGGLGRFSPWSYQPVTMTKAKYGDAGYQTIVKQCNRAAHLT